MEVTLNSLQKQVDQMIETRIFRLSQNAYNQANRLPSGKIRKKHKQYSLPQEVTDLLELRQKLYAGENPESIAATITNGEIQHQFLK